MGDLIDDPRQLDWVDQIQRERDQELARRCIKREPMAAKIDKGASKYEPRHADT